MTEKRSEMDPEEEFQAALQTLFRHRTNLKAIKDEYVTNQRIRPDDLEWLFEITRLNFNLIESEEKYIRELRRKVSSLELDLILNNQEIYELRVNGN